MKNLSKIEILFFACVFFLLGLKLLAYQPKEEVKPFVKPAASQNAAPSPSNESFEDIAKTPLVPEAASAPAAPGSFADLSKN